MIWTRYRLQSCISVEKNSFIFHFSTPCSFVFFRSWFSWLMASSCGQSWSDEAGRYVGPAVCALDFNAVVVAAICK